MEMCSVFLTRVSADDTDIMKQSFRNEMEKLLEKLMHGADGRNEKMYFHGWRMQMI